MCGLCLPHCPTYVQSGREPESPRGRIALMQALADGRLAPSPALQAHLDHCLNCRACEAMCPSQVPYGRMIREMRSWLGAQKPAPKPDLAATVLRGGSQGAGLLRGSLQVYRRSGLPSLVESSGLLGQGRLGRLNALLAATPPRRRPLPAETPAQGEQRGRVLLFGGCTSSLLDTATLEAAVTLLSRLGYAVQLPPGQGCCGGLDLQAGQGEAARELARRNLKAFASASDTPILSVASGCGATLHDYGDWLGGEARGFAARVQDVSAFLATCAWPEDLQLKPLQGHVAVHSPCSLKSVLHQDAAPLALLRRIPDLEVSTLADNGQCCGAAGRYMLEQPEMARALRQDKIDALAVRPPDWLVSSNIGCALHLGAGLREAGLKLEVLHPLTLLARQLPAAGGSRRL